MFDIHTSTITPEIAWVSIILYIGALLYSFSFFKRPIEVNNKGLGLFWFLFFVVFAVTYAIDSDFFHYKEIVCSTYEVVYSLEPLYTYIILFVNNNYFLFRVIVFGGAVLVYCYSLERYEVDVTTGVLLMLIIYGSIFSYARASLAFSIYYLGLSFIVQKKGFKKTVLNNLSGKLLSTVMGIVLIISSYFFHRSMLLLITLTPFAFFRLEKKSVYLLVIISPLVLFLFRFILGDVISWLTFDAAIDQRIGYYSDDFGGGANWKGVVDDIVHYGKYLLCFIIISSAVFHNYSNLSNRIKSLYSFYFVLSYVSVLCYPLLDGNIIFMHRFLKMTINPQIIIIAYLYGRRFLPFSRIKWIVLLSVFGHFLRFAHYII